MVSLPSLDFAVRYQYGSSPSGIEVPVEIIVDRDRKVGLIAKIDTGADCCIFQREYADFLDLPMDDGERKRILTATGAFDTRGHLVTLSTLGYKCECLAFFAVDEGLPRNVLGLQGWLEKFRFGLVHYDRSIYLSHYDE